MSLLFRGYLRALANFPKILVAGVHGECIGLGVTMLPLFDMVITCDNAMFSIPNAKLGCAAEGGSLLSLPHLMHNVLVSFLLDLLYKEPTDNFDCRSANCCTRLGN